VRHEPCSRKSLAERKRFYEIAGDSIIEIDAALNIAVEFNYTLKKNFQNCGDYRSDHFN
jgi:four helix bundle protein